MADVNPHLDEATWDRFASGELDATAQDAALDHITACPRCLRIWRGLDTLKSEAQAQGLIPADAPVRDASLRSPAVMLAVAATLILVIGGIALNRRLNDPNELRGRAPKAVEQTTTTIAADGVPTLTWAPVSGATLYRVEMFSEDGHPVWTLDVSAPPARWPVDVLRPAGTYRWQVEALDAGVVLARSRIVVLKVAP